MRAARKLAAFCFKFTRENKQAPGEGAHGYKGHGCYDAGDGYSFTDNRSEASPRFGGGLEYYPGG